MSFDLIRRSSGPFIRDPRRLPRFTLDDTSILRSYSAATVAANTPVFYTGAVGSIDRIPGSVTTNTSWSADTFKTILSYTGAGLLCNLVSPVPADAAATVTFRVTLDSIAYTFTGQIVTGGTDRVVVGWGLPLDAYHATTNYGIQHASASPDGLTAVLNSANGFVLLGPEDPRIPFLVTFDNSILVEMKMSTAASSSGSTVPNRAAAVMIANT